MKRIDVAIAVVVFEGKILICQRKSGDTFGGYWEFPGGKCEPGERVEDCLARELREELDIEIEPTEKFPVIAHNYPTADLTLHPFLCRHVSGQPRMIECQKIEWVLPDKLADYRFPPANHALLNQIVQRLKSPSADVPCNS
jgi:mutator protein MutT